MQACTSHCDVSQFQLCCTLTVMYLVSRLRVSLIHFSVGHLIRLLVHTGRATEDVLLQMWEGVQNDASFSSLTSIQIIYNCRPGTLEAFCLDNQ